ncbi:hypothetical protein J6590_100661 [Homalodisca vitripennis]|nr:hypothetical protein J6590_100661 [Homalodisca vitripennis]
MSQIRACLLDISSDESDVDNGRNSDVGTDLEDLPASDLSPSLLDHSSGSGEEYDPNFDQNQYIDSDNNIQVNNQPTSSIGRPQTNLAQTSAHNLSDVSDNESDYSDQSAQQNPQPAIWVMVFPPEPEVNLGNQFRVRMTGVKNLPEKIAPH